MNKIHIPDYAKTLNIDIGLSFCACHTNQWIKNNKDVFVISIEALPDNVKRIKEGKQTDFHHRPKEHYLNTEFIDKRCVILNKAIVNNNDTVTRFFKTKDFGQCSIYRPPSNKRNIYEVEQEITVESCKLKDIIESIVFNDTVQFISYIKIDVQGADLDVVKSGENVLVEKVAYITLEAETTYGSGNKNSYENINAFLSSIGFIRIFLPNVQDPTFLNSRFTHVYPPHQHNIICIQNN